MASIFDISRIAGVSKSTVSRVLSGTGSFSEDVAQKVWEVAAQLHYRPNHLARAMKTKQTQIIGVVVYRKHMPIISHPFYAPILDSIAHELKNHRYGILLIPDSDVSIDSGEWLMKHQVDGLVLLSQITRDLIDYFKGSSIPFVLVNNSDLVNDVNSVVNDDYQGALVATEHLLDQGYQRIAVIAGPAHHRSYRLRLQGFRDALAQRGLTVLPEHIHSGDSQLETGTAAARCFITQSMRPQAIFACNDMMAIGALRELYAHHIQVPRDMALVGFDDIDYARLTTPALTTVRVDKGEMGRIAVRKLLAMLHNDADPPTGIVLAPKLIVRESSRRAIE